MQTNGPKLQNTTQKAMILHALGVQVGATRGLALFWIGSLTTLKAQAENLLTSGGAPPGRFGVRGRKLGLGPL